MLNLVYLFKYILKLLSDKEESKDYAAKKKKKIERGGKRWCRQLTNKIMPYFPGLSNGRGLWGRMDTCVCMGESDSLWSMVSDS